MASLRLSASRSLPLASFNRVPSRPFSSRLALRATGDYGSGTGDPKGENPQEQGRNPQVHKEHPGPPPPSNAGGSSSSSSASSSGSSSQSSNGASPRIHSDSRPSQESEDVRKHNEEMDKRSDRAKADSTDEKVDPKYWKGHADDKV